jgi:hypothetical protein
MSDRRIEYKSLPTCRDINKDCPDAVYVDFQKVRLCRHQTGVVVCELGTMKRKPDMFGTLHLRHNELVEFSKFFSNEISVFQVVVGKENTLVIDYYKGKNVGEETATNFKAIAWILERFDLTGE